jgi:hypothetical protein
MALGLPIVIFVIAGLVPVVEGGLFPFFKDDFSTFVGIHVSVQHYL